MRRILQRRGFAEQVRKPNASKHAPALHRAGRDLLNAPHSGVEGLAGILFGELIAIFVASGIEACQRGMPSVLPPRARPRAVDVIQGCALVIRRWFTGRLLVMAITRAMTALALGVIGVDHGPLIALRTGLLTVGVTLGTESDKVLWVTLAYLAIRPVKATWRFRLS